MPTPLIPSNPMAHRVLLLLWLARRRWYKLLPLVNVILGCDFYAAVPHPIHMPHPNGVVVHSRARTGQGLTIMHQVTLGERSPTRQSVFPTIGDDVFIGTGAKILGEVSIGHGAIIGANAVVTRSVPPGYTVVGFNRLLEPAASFGDK